MALLAEARILAHPASVDNVPTDGGKEDHVSMGMTAATKLRAIVDNAEARNRDRIDRRQLRVWNIASRWLRVAECNRLMNWFARVCRRSLADRSMSADIRRASPKQCARVNLIRCLHSRFS